MHLPVFRKRHYSDNVTSSQLLQQHVESQQNNTLDPRDGRRNLEWYGFSQFTQVSEQVLIGRRRHVRF